MKLRREANELRRRRRVLGAVLVAAVCGPAAVGLGGCGASNTNTIDPVARAAYVSTSSSGFRMTFSMRMSSPALPAPIKATGVGAFDVPAHSGSLNLEMNLGNIPEAQQVLGASTLRMQELIKGLTVYMKLPTALTRRASVGRPWLKIDLAKVASSAGVPGLSSLVNNPASGDPSQILGYLRETSGSVTNLGTEAVGGIPTTHYRAQVSLDRVPNAFPPASRAQVRQTVAALEQLTHVHLLPVQVWVDGQHLIRRMQMSYNEAVAGQSLAALMRFDIPEYGPQPPPPLPPASQVTDVGALTGGSTSGVTP